MACVLDTIAWHRAAFATYGAIIDASPNDAPAVSAAARAERAAFGDLIAAPVVSLADVTAKAAYLLDEVDAVGDYFSEGEEVVTSFLQSLRAPAGGVGILPDPMLGAVNAHRAWIAAYAAADFDSGQAETAWIETNPDHGGDKLADAPPLPTSEAGAFAAIRLVIDDKDRVEPYYAAILRQALAFLDGSASA